MERDIFLKAASGSETICLEVVLGLMSHCSKSVVIFIFLQFCCFFGDFRILNSSSQSL